MYTNKTYGLAFETGEFVSTPIGEIGFITGYTMPGVLVRLNCAGRVNGQCLTPKASHDSLWVFQPHELVKVDAPKRAEVEACEPVQA